MALQDVCRHMYLWNYVVCLICVHLYAPSDDQPTLNMMYLNETMNGTDPTLTII